MASPPRLDGLDEARARALLEEVGPNVLQQAAARGLVEIVLGTFREPMFLFLIAAAVLYLVFGGLGEGLFLLGGAVISIGLVIFQEARSERALAALRRLSEPFARVIRSGRERRIPAREIVPGDILLVAEGERLPADGLLVGGDLLTVDESTLTGESVPVTKALATEAAADADPAPGGDDTPFLFAGTLVVRGQGVMQCRRTGAATRLGRIGASLASIETEPTLLQRTTARLIAKFGIVALAFCSVVFVAYGLFRGNWFEGALAGITLAISLLPEEFPMVLAIFMAIGAWRLAQRNVLVRRAAVLETLGAATMLCVDKTGTLTENRMTVTALWRDGALHEVGAAADLRREAAELIGKAALASAVRPVDPMDRAIRTLAESFSEVPGQDPLQTHPLRANLLAVVQVWPNADGGVTVAAKGAPEAIFGLCRMDAGSHARMQQVVADMAARGLRVLGVASVRSDGAVPADFTELTFGFEGLVGFFDPVRGDVAEALRLAAQAGIAVAMITGDYPATALEIARRCGIAGHGVLTGPEIAAMTPEVLRARARQVRVFARILPEQKLTLVEAFKANGEVVAMTGDGVNDAPALEAAHIGIAMGQRGTDVAREAADLVLLDDSFASIVGGVRLGRRIFTNLRKALIYVTAIHVPVAGLALLPIVLGLPPVLFPMHVVLLELIIDPVCALVFEAEPSERDAMNRPPRPADEPLFGLGQLAFGILQGAVVLIGAFGVYAFALWSGVPDTQARAAGFGTLVASNLVLAFADSAETGSAFFDRRRLVFWLIAGTAALIVAAILFVPPLARIFQLAPPPPALMALALAVSVLGGGWFGILRRLGLAGRTDMRPDLLKS